VREATQTALETADERAKTYILRTLAGVEWPTASVILHFCNRQPYPILDYRALWSLLADGDEGNSEIDLVIEASSWVWFIEAKHLGDISPGTTTRPGRDQILRNVDVGTYYAGVRQFSFSLLISSEQRSPDGVKTLREYSDFAAVRKKLAAHRPDGLANLHSIGKITWFQLAEVLANAEKGAPREDERAYAARVLAWLRERVLSRSGA